MPGAGGFPQGGGSRRGGIEVALGAGAVAGAGAGPPPFGCCTRRAGSASGRSARSWRGRGEILGHNLPVAAQCLLLLTGADFSGLAGIGSPAVRGDTPGRGRPGGGRASRWRPGGSGARDLVSQVLVAAIGVNIALFVVTDRVYAVSSAREIAPVLPFAAALAGRQLAGPLLVAWRARQADPVTRATGTGPSRWPAARRPPGWPGWCCAGAGPGRGGLPGRARVRTHRAGLGAAGGRAHYLAGAAPPRHRPVRLLGSQRGHADQRRPGRGAAGQRGRRPGRARARGGPVRLVRPGAVGGALRGAVPRRPRLPGIHRPAGGTGHLRRPGPASTRPGRTPSGTGRRTCWPTCAARTPRITGGLRGVSHPRFPAVAVDWPRHRRGVRVPNRRPGNSRRNCEGAADIPGPTRG